MYYYIVNPAAGKGQAKVLQTRIRARLAALGIAGEWATTAGPGEASRMATSAVARGHTTIVAVGGDDTVNEVVNGLTDNRAALGVIPIGANNRLAAQLGITSWQQACEVLAARRLTSFGLIAAGQKFFISTLTLGFETDLDKNTDTPRLTVRDRALQLQKSWRHARNYSTLQSKIVVDDEYALQADIFSLTIANQKFLNPLADNKLVVSLLNRPNRRELSSYLWQLSRKGGSRLEDEPTTRFLATRVVIETTPPTGIMVDGKVAGRTPVAIRLTDRRIRFITEKPAHELKL